jgi:hypothetical protein
VACRLDGALHLRRQDYVFIHLDREIDNVLIASDSPDRQLSRLDMEHC